MLVRRARHFDVICRVLDRNILPPPEMWSLGVCLNIYSRARSSQHNDRDSLAALGKVRCFRFAVDAESQSQWDPADPAWLWQHQISWQGKSHSPENFDWLVDYLSNVCSNNYKTAGDILVLLCSMRASCSPASQQLYIEKLIACMGSIMPPRLRHAALRAAHSIREVLASIDVVDDADMMLTNFSSAILTAVCPQPGATPTSDGPDRFFHPSHDLCYLELIFALVRNSVWHPHLSGNSHINWCSSIVAKSCHFHMNPWFKHFNALQPHAFYLAGIFLRTTSEYVSVTSPSSITE
ncbi:uncharacterized protein BJ212DRAFT_1483188 [Suillus subaureus]|uniref:Uncharacterized protein n=1 Tax=Suillus subaureus TaxID=48587 RepID=A0A9P7E705_9AGAM|nr:uncharacterized protein BJ212DRAFT_1483188 [Suillus subaureus]KAG1812582.1 hypothetical protein BJ212DRAFT_1483188 [Suillus subaureus]